MINIKKHFQNFYEVPFLDKHSITVGNGQQIVAHKMIALPLQIQNHYFEFLVLVVDILDEYDFIIGLEEAIQLEAVYHMTMHVVNIQPRSVPLFSNKISKFLQTHPHQFNYLEIFLVLLLLAQQLLEFNQ